MDEKRVDDVKRLDDALKYSVSSHMIEKLKITEEELEEIKEELLKVIDGANIDDKNGNTLGENASLLYSILKKIMDDSFEFEKESVNNGKIRK